MRSYSNNLYDLIPMDLYYYDTGTKIEATNEKEKCAKDAVATKEKEKCAKFLFQCQ